MGFLNWVGQRADNFANAGDWTVDRLGKTGEWITDDGKSSPKPPAGDTPNITQYYNRGNYNFSSVPGYTGWSDEPGPRINPDDFANSGDSGASAAAYVQSLIQGINEAYDRQRGALDTNKATSSANISKNYDAFKQGLASNQALYQQGSQAIQAEITRRMAESAARNTELGNRIGGAVGSIGGNAAVPQAQVAANGATLASSQGFQQDLGNRLDQIVGANQQSAANSGELVRQGASGNLENSYNAMLNALLANREQSILQAQQAGSGGGGGGGGTDYSKAYKQYTDRNKLDMALNGETPSESDILNSMLRAGGSEAVTALTYLNTIAQQDPNKNKGQ